MGKVAADEVEALQSSSYLPQVCFPYSSQLRLASTCSKVLLAFVEGAAQGVTTYSGGGKDMSFRSKTCDSAEAHVWKRP